MNEATNERTESLLEVGFSPKEAKVYLALLKLGRGSVTKISREAQILRTTAYDVLNSLFNKNLVTLSGKEPKQEYVAESPDQIKKYINTELENKRESLKRAEIELIPQLKSIYNISARPKVMFYEGTEGVEQVYEDTLTSHETIRAYANVNEMHLALPKYFPQYYKRRRASGISIRAILPANEAGLDRSTKDNDEARESALVPADKFYFSPEINIYDNKVMIASWKEKLGIIIESQEIADAMKTIFELAWSEAKRLDKELK